MKPKDVMFAASVNNRVQGWSALKEFFKIREDGKPGLIIFDTCKALIDCIKGL